MAAETLVTVTITPEAQELISFAKTFLATATAVRITTPEEAQAAVDQTRAIKECGKAVDETRKAMTIPLDEQKKAIMDVFRPAVDVLAQAEQLLKGAIGTWQAEQARLAAEAKKERCRQEQLERERQAKEQAEAARLVQEADAARAAGDFSKAEALEDQAVAAQEVAAPFVCPVAVLAPTKPKGSSVRTTWKCKVVDPSKLERAYLMPNQVMLDALASTAKGVGPAPAGCEWTSSDSVSIR